VEVPPGPLPLQPVRNADFKEVVLDVDGAPALRFASAYGFRNIQTLMRQMKRRRCAYDYVEVMACPSGDSHKCRGNPMQSSQASVWEGRGRSRRTRSTMLGWSGCWLVLTHAHFGDIQNPLHQMSRGLAPMSREAADCRGARLLRSILRSAVLRQPLCWCSHRLGAC